MDINHSFVILFQKSNLLIELYWKFKIASFHINRTRLKTSRGICKLNSVQVHFIIYEPFNTERVVFPLQVRIVIEIQFTNRSFPALARIEEDRKVCRECNWILSVCLAKVPAKVLEGAEIRLRHWVLTSKVNCFHNLWLVFAEGTSERGRVPCQVIVVSSFYWSPKSRLIDWFCERLSACFPDINVN